MRGGHSRLFVAWGVKRRDERLASPPASESSVNDRGGPPDAVRLAQSKNSSGKSTPPRRRSPGLVGVSVEYDDVRCQSVQSRYSIRIPAGATMVDVDGYRYRSQIWPPSATAPAPYLFLSRGVHQVRFRQNESAVTSEIDKDFVDEYAKMRSFFGVEQAIHDRDLLQRSARAMDVHGAPFLLNFLGASYAKSDRWQAAERTFHRALAVNPCFAPAHLNLAECFLHRGARDRAAQEIDLAEAFNVENVFGLAGAISRMRVDLKQPPFRSSLEPLTLPNYETSETISDQDRRIIGVLRSLAKYAVADEERCKILNNIGVHFADAGKTGGSAGPLSLGIGCGAHRGRAAFRIGTSNPRAHARYVPQGRLRRSGRLRGNDYSCLSVTTRERPWRELRFTLC